MSQPQSSPEPVMAGVPYLDDDADIVLRSSDGVHFHVHKLLLSKCSLVFADMFSLPQPKPSGKESTREERPVIQMAEDQHTLRLLLGFCYPAGVATVHLLKDIRVELGLTKKYQMPQTWKRLKSDLLMHVSTEPEKVFAISWSFEMKDVVVAAAKQSLHNPWFEQPFEGPAPPEFDYIPATAMYKLVQYQRLCVAAAIVIVSDAANWIDGPCLKSLPVFINDNCDCKELDLGLGFRSLGSRQRWVRGFRDRARSVVKKNPIGAAVKTPAILATSVAEAANCKKCSLQLPGVVLTLEILSGRLATAVDAKVATVQLETPF